MIGEALASRLYSPAREEVRLAASTECGRTSDAAVWPSVSLVISLPLVALPVVKPESEASVLGWTPEFEELPVEFVAAAAGDDVDDAAGAGAVLGGEGVGEHGHLVDGHQRNVGEDGLAAPPVVGVGAVDFKPGLAAARAVGGEEILVHEDVALIDGGAIGGVEQRQSR